jgi:hypothetical protein
MSVLAPEKRSSRWDAVPVVARFALALLLAGYLLFAHGCHGDEDNELFGAAVPRTCDQP